MADLNSQFEKKHLRNIRKYQKRIQSAYYKVIEKIFKQSTNVKIKGKTFRISDFPNLKNTLDEVLLEFRTEIEAILVNGIEEEWKLSNAKNDELYTKALAGRKIWKELKDLAFNKNEAVLEAFIKRKTNGLNLSDRVWNLSNQFSSEIEQVLYVGISEGKPAATMARDARKYLREPEKLFRRVRNAKGKLVLSKAAREYHPGQGVYRSSYKNSFRLARTEPNDAYRSSDFERWNKTRFVLGIEVKLSAAHPKRDICDHLTGTYSKDFKFRGWHAQCICFAVPILPSAEEFDKYQDSVLNGTDKNFKFKGEIKDIPAEAKSWLTDNSDRIAGWKSKPYFIKDNSKFVSEFL